MYKRQAQFAIDTYGAIDILVNDAGTMPLGFLSQHKFAMQAWEECIDTSIKGTLYATAAVYDQMIKQGPVSYTHLDVYKRQAPRGRME